MPVLTLRLSVREQREIQRRARLAGTNVSAYVRSTLLPQEPKPEGNPRIVRDKATGSLVLYSPTGTPSLTSEAVRDALADFP